MTQNEQRGSIGDVVSLYWSLPIMRALLGERFMAAQSQYKIYVDNFLKHTPGEGHTVSIGVSPIHPTAFCKGINESAFSDPNAEGMKLIHSNGRFYVVDRFAEVNFKSIDPSDPEWEARMRTRGQLAQLAMSYSGPWLFGGDADQANRTIDEEGLTLAYGVCGAKEFETVIEDHEVSGFPKPNSKEPIDRFMFIVRISGISTEFLIKNTNRIFEVFDADHPYRLGVEDGKLKGIPKEDVS